MRQEVWVGLLVGCSAACVLDRNGQQAGEPDPPPSDDDAGVGGSGGPSVPPPAQCNDGHLQLAEQCDGAELGGESCASRGFIGGELGCTMSCTFDTSGCVSELCGNGQIDSGEICDGNDLGSASCLTEGFAGGEASCVGCQISGCMDHYSEDFEGAAPLSVWDTSGIVGWTTSLTRAHGGVQSAESGAIVNQQATGAMLTLRYEVAGTISFWYFVSSELNFDYLRFALDTTELMSDSGEKGWTLVTFDVPAGDHTFSWRYTKDQGVTQGDDRAWIDDVVAVNGYRVP